MRRFVGFSVTACAAIGVGFVIGAPKSADAVGPGCSELAGQSVDYNGASGTVNIGAGVFNAGDVLVFALDTLVLVNLGLRVEALINGPVSIFQNVAPTATGAQSVSITVPQSGNYTLQGNSGFGATAADEFRVTFLGCNVGGAKQAIAGQAARASFAQQSGLVFQRTANLLLNKPENRVNPNVQTGALPQAGLLGSAGQGSGPFGVWADFTWSGLENDDAAVGSDANVFTLTGGYDTPLTDRLIAGAAVSLGGATFDPTATNDSAHEINVGITPYLAYQIDDVFALQAAAGWTHARGFAETGGVDGDYAANRYFLAGEASAFKTWGDFSLFSSVGVLWGQSFQQAYTDDRGLEFGSVRTNLGSVSVTAQPSYLFTVDAAAGDFIEPYILGQYSYDFSQTKVAGAANDPDEVLLGAGVNGFTGDGLSGAVEFSRTVGREDNTATSVRATVRIDF